MFRRHVLLVIQSVIHRWLGCVAGRGAGAQHERWRGDEWPQPGAEEPAEGAVGVVHMHGRQQRGARHQQRRAALRQA